MEESMDLPVCGKAPEEIRFVRQVAVALAAIHKSFLWDASLEASEWAAKHLAGELALRLEKVVYAHPLGRMVVEYPATPWEHFRDVYFPKYRLGRWFLKRKPVRKTAVVKSAFASFPESHCAWPEGLGPMTLLLRDL